MTVRFIGYIGFNNSSEITAAHAPEEGDFDRIHADAQGAGTPALAS